MKRNSWHARLYLFFKDAEDKRLPDNFCSYFWGLIGGVLKAGTAVLVLTFFFVGLPFLWFFRWTPNGEPFAWYHAFLPHFMVVVCVVAATLSDWSRHSDSLLRIYLDSFKNNYCPRLSWDDEEAKGGNE